MEYKILDNSEFVSDKVPLTDEERDLLIYIYRKGLRFFLTVFLSLMFIALYSSIGVPSSNLLGKGIGLGMLECILIIAAIVTFKRSIYSFKIDYKNGVKEQVTFMIIKKEIMEYTGQYFISLNNPRHLFQEVDKDTWYKCNIGDPFIVYRAPKAKYYFNPRGEFEII